VKAAVLADDLTGALEMGALLRARVASRWSGDCPDDALVVNLATRHLTAEAAYERTRAALALLPVDVPLFKKVDSTLRGPIAAGMAALPAERPVVFTPAYPAMGRTVREGCLLIGGVPVAETEFAHDPRQPVRASRIVPAALDAATDEDLQRLVRDAPAEAIFVGSGGLGRAWAAARLALAPDAREFPRPKQPLVVCGSRHPRALAQARAARETGVTVLMPPDGVTDAGAILGNLAERALAMEADALILFGGDTAAAVLERRGDFDLWAIKELQPGVVWSRTAAGLTVITKAGGFGGVDLVGEILA